MKRSAGSGRARAAFGAMGMLALLALAVPSAEAEVGIPIPSVPKPRPPISAIQPQVPQEPRVSLNMPGARSVSVPALPGVPAQRGTFARFWDWLLGRKPAPAQAPQVAHPAPAPAGPGAPAAAPNNVAPIPSARPPAGPPSFGPPPAAQVPEQDAQRAARLGGSPAAGGAAAGAAAGAGSAAAANQAFGPRGAEAGKGGDARSAAPASVAETPAPKPSGYVLHLTNGSSIPVASYEEKGDQVLIVQRQGTYGLPRSLVARIETREAEPEAASPGRDAR